jgi:LEA14-like dessication related protein
MFSLTSSLTRLCALLIALILTACSGLVPRAPVNVDVVGVEPGQGQGMEGRFLVKLRVQNPSDKPIDYDGVYVELEVRGIRMASGVSDERGSVPRFGESVITVPVSVPISALVRQAMSLAGGNVGKIDYAVKGQLNGPMFGGASFRSKGEFSLPASAAGAAAGAATP